MLFDLVSECFLQQNCPTCSLCTRIIIRYYHIHSPRTSSMLSLCFFSWVFIIFRRLSTKSVAVGRFTTSKRDIHVGEGCRFLVTSQQCYLSCFMSKDIECVLESCVKFPLPLFPFETTDIQVTQTSLDGEQYTLYDRHLRGRPCL